jgi:hypothetical protein
MVPPRTLADYRNWASLRIDALNHAVRGLPKGRTRYHICWGSWNGPHMFDVPIKDIVDLVLRVDVGAYSFEADAGFGLKPHRLGDRVGEVFFERCLVVGLFVANFFQVRNYGRRAHQAADMGCDDAMIRPQHVSPPRYGRCCTGTHTVSSKPRDGIMERLIAQDPVIIVAGASGSDS